MRKFQQIFEGNFQRFQGGGFLTGDLVKFRQGWNSNPWCKSLGENTITQLNTFAEGKYNIRVSAVKTLRPQVQGSTQQDVGASNQYFCDIALEKAPGLFLDFIEVPSEILEYVDTGINLSPVSDENKREDEIKIKPEDVQVEKDEHEKEIDNPDSNTTLPGATAAKSYTANYIGN